MADLYVQVEAGFPHSKLVDRTRAACGVSTNEAIGLYVRLWLAVLERHTGGSLAERSDAWIEEAAGWRGEPGQFAAVVKQWHLDGNGHIREWHEKYGALEQKRAIARDRKRDQRSRVPATVLGTEGETQGGTGAETAEGTNGATAPGHRGGRLITSPTAVAVGSSYRATRTENSEQAEPEVGEFDVFTGDVKAMLRAAQSPRSALASLRMLVQEGAEPALVGRAVQEMAANGEKFNVARLRGFVRSLKAGPPREPATLHDGESMLDRALAWSRTRGGYKHIQPGDYTRDVPEDVRAALSLCGGLKAFETADDIGLRALRKKFVLVYRPEVTHARA